MDTLSDLKKSLPGKGKKHYAKVTEEEMREQRRIRAQKLDRDIANSKPPSGEWVRGRNNSPSPPNSPKRNSEKSSHKSHQSTASSSQAPPQQHSRQPVDIQKYIDAENPHYPFLKGAGVVGWRFNGKRLQFLMSRKNGKLDCFGGKVEYEIDVDSAATAAREFVEEVSCEPYLYLMNLYPEDCPNMLKDAQAYFEPLIRNDRNLVRDGIAWGVYFCEFPHIPIECFREREDMLTRDDGDLFKPEWVDVWQLCDKTQVVKRLAIMNFASALERIYAQDEKREKKQAEKLEASDE